MMTRRAIAAIDDSSAAAPVLAAAEALAPLLDATVEVVHVPEEGKQTAVEVADHAGFELRMLAGEPVDAIVDAVRDPGVVLVALGARGQPAGPRPIGHVATEILQRVDVPVLVVPPDAGIRAGTTGLRRVLFPLQGTRETTAAVSDLMHRMCQSGTEVLAVHVFDPTTVPAFWDHEGHTARSWADQFAARWCHDPVVVDLRLRRGAPSDAILDLAVAEGVDLIVLGWSQDLSPGRAAVVRGALTRSTRPVLLVPAPTMDDAGAV